jgi:hypothetical protein
MDLTFQDIARWTADDVNAQILAILPEGWKFDLQTHPDHWRAAYKDNDVEVWADTHWELRLLLLNAFAWLWQRRTPTRVHPAWRPQPSRPLVPIRPSDQSVPEPEDLDPGHIKSVYAAHARKYGKETG